MGFSAVPAVFLVSAGFNTRRNMMDNTREDTGDGIDSSNETPVFWTSHPKYVLTRGWLVVACWTNDTQTLIMLIVCNTENWVEQKSGPVFSIWVTVAVWIISIYGFLLFTSLSHVYMLFFFLFCLDLFFWVKVCNRPWGHFNAHLFCRSPHMAWCLQSYV